MKTLYLTLALIMSWIQLTPSLKSSSVRLHVLQPPLSQRSLKQTTSLHKTLKLPVWPIWGGVIAQVADWLKLHGLSQRILSLVGGRVVPISLMSSQSGFDVSPFLLLVHHRHSFHPLDPFRFLTRIFLPEGFPAHPHAGFDTVTYTLSGGLRHRDSDALRMNYADGDVQWMRAGSGIIHEEMWTIERRVELFQLWIDLPSQHKNDVPFCHVIPNASFPVVHFPHQRLAVKVLSGDCDAADGDSGVTRGPGSDLAASPVGLYHISRPMPSDEAGESDVCSLSVDGANFALFYLRAGELLTSSKETVLPGDFLLFLCDDSEAETEATSVQVDLRAGVGVSFDGLLLSGRRLKQPVLSAGSFIESDEKALMTSVRSFQLIESLQGFWDHRVSDEQWRRLCDSVKVGDVIRRFKGLDKSQ